MHDFEIVDYDHIPNPRVVVAHKTRHCGWYQCEHWIDATYNSMMVPLEDEPSKQMFSGKKIESMKRVGAICYALIYQNQNV